jgi:hypothetical protein
MNENSMFDITVNLLKLWMQRVYKMTIIHAKIVLKIHLKCNKKNIGVS